jgi:hypothetical protein
VVIQIVRENRVIATGDGLCEDLPSFNLPIPEQGSSSIDVHALVIKKAILGDQPLGFSYGKTTQELTAGANTVTVDVAAVAASNTKKVNSNIKGTIFSIRFASGGEFGTITRNSSALAPRDILLPVIPGADLGFLAFGSNDFVFARIIDNTSSAIIFNLPPPTVQVEPVNGTQNVDLGTQKFVFTNSAGGFSNVELSISSSDVNKWGYQNVSVLTNKTTVRFDIAKIASAFGFPANPTANSALIWRATGLNAGTNVADFTAVLGLI